MVMILKIMLFMETGITALWYILKDLDMFLTEYKVKLTTVLLGMKNETGKCSSAGKRKK